MKVLLVLALCAASPAPAGTDALARARAAYFAGDVLEAARAFEAAVRKASTDAAAWSDGAIAEAEAGRPDKAVEWSRRAAELAPSAQTHAALALALLRVARPSE